MKDVQLGKLTVKKVFESEGQMPMTMVLPGVTAENLAELKAWYWSDDLSLDPDKAAFKLSMHTYVLQVGGLNIVIDTCNGNDKNRSMDFCNKLQTNYLANFAKTGLTPEDIDIVLCTHLHCDHVGWNTRLENGQWVPTFPNARYLFSRKDYEFFAKQQHEVLHREAFDDSVLPVIEAGLAEIVESDHIVDRRIGEGIWLADAAGHSAGCVVIYAQDGGPRALFSGDCFHHPIQLIRPDLGFFADENPDMAVAVRQKLLAEHADTDTVFFPAHFRKTSAGRVKTTESGSYRYVFLEPEE